MSQQKLISGWDWVGWMVSGYPGGVKYRAAYAANKR